MKQDHKYSLLILKYSFVCTEAQCAKFARDMPPLHRDLIKALAMGPSIRHFGKQRNVVIML